MTEYRHVRSIKQYGLLPGGVSTAGNKQRNMNQFLPIDGLLVSYEHIRPTANVILVLSKATLEKHPELMEDFCLSKNGYFLTKAVIPAGLFSLAWDIRNNCCVSTKLWGVPDSTPAMSVPDEPYLRFYSQLYCEVLRLVGKGHDKFKAETRRLAFKNIKIREVGAWREEAEEKLDRHQLHGMSKIHTKTWLNFLSLDDDWKDEATNMRRLKKRSLSETTEEEGDDLIDLDDDDDMEVDADIPADDDDEVQVISNLASSMVDDLAEACQKGTWVKKGTVKKEESDMPDDPSAAASSSAAVKKEEKQSTRVWSSRARSRTPSRTVLKKADHAPGAARTPSESRRVSFSDIPETKYIEATSKKRATSRAREVISDARKAQKAPTKFHRRPDEMTCLTCANAVYSSSAEHVDMEHALTATTMPVTIVPATAFISVRPSQTPICRHRWVSTSAKRSPPKLISRFPSQPNPRVGILTTVMSVDCTVCKKSKILFSVAAQQVMPRWIELYSKESANTITRTIQHTGAVPFPRSLNIGTNSLMWHHTQSFGQAAITTPIADIPARRCDRLSS